ncbi:DUF4136 domain-containing protein [Flavobacterium pectinovorum]|uniref:DUF4136 domain-containing protein n=1 Tax=Flavobacterium pectinovorum TaxID=29533 RepID=UPI001FABEDA6|nr:DUF4136 domain-containing protein [Flavobacterium pectinovorum]MCI9846371.1 DUF4136 domain-containing protein [Flavobacterium pectinovorum]
MNIKSKNVRIIPMFLLGLFFSCSPTVNVTRDYDYAVNFSEFKTFTVYDLKAQEGQVNELNADRITKAIRAEMIAKGFTESTTNPDLKVNAVSILKNKTSVTANSYYDYGTMHRPYRYWGSGSMLLNNNTVTLNTDDYLDGSLIIDIVSAKTGKLVWQGLGNAEIDSKLKNPEEFINSAIKKILAGFPPDAVKK